MPTLGPSPEERDLARGRCEGEISHLTFTFLPYFRVAAGLLGGHVVARRYRKDVTGESIGELEAKLPSFAHAYTSFGGRTAAIGKVAAMLAEYRSVTGPGGVGKGRPSSARPWPIHLR